MVKTKFWFRFRRTTWSNLWIYTRRIVTRIRRPFKKLNVCAKSVENRLKLAMHLRWAPFHYKRPVCGTVTGISILIFNQQKHSYTHTGYDNRPYSCTICPRKYATKHKLKEHVMRHDGKCVSLERKVDDSESVKLMNCKSWHYCRSQKSYLPILRTTKNYTARTESSHKLSYAWEVVAL